MTTVLFIHGTGVRDEGAKKTFEKIKSHLGNSANGQIMEVKYCSWGELEGARIDLIPDMLFSNPGARGADLEDKPATITADQDFSEFEQNMQIWFLLQEDPFFELRRLAGESKKTDTQQGLDAGALAGSREDNNAGSGKDNNFRSKIMNAINAQGDFTVLTWNPGNDAATQQRVNVQEKYGISPKILHTAIQIVISNDIYDEAVKASSDIVLFTEVLSRAILAVLLRLINTQPDLWEHQEILTLQKQDQLLQDLQNVFEPNINRAIIDWFENPFGMGVTSLIKMKRESLMLLMARGVGDVILNLRHGEKVAEMIASEIKKIKDENLIVITHSLGAMIVFNQLIKQKHDPAFDKIKLFVSVGAQIPFFYAMMGFEELVPDYNSNMGKSTHDARKPKAFWLNIYNPNDFLSFPATNVFLWGENKVMDLPLKFRTAFPASHGQYFAEKEMYQRIRDVWQSIEAGKPGDLNA